jgi:hypothetical protein
VAGAKIEMAEVRERLFGRPNLAGISALPHGNMVLLDREPAGTMRLFVWFDAAMESG